ncbi:MAG TPA: allantoate amidohydrolase [Acidobacteriaceae bacterium]|nr:allantoate amidohydrolase [Acidobacteriaceae bacterium]
MHTARAERVIARCREIAQCTEIAGETTRTFLAPAMHRVHELFSEWMRAAGMAVHVDAAGNLRGVLESAEEEAPRLLIGSHLDTVANAGAFDGILGVVMGVALVEGLAVQNAATGVMPYAIEVIGFSEEEGVRFGKPFLGSLALIGELKPEVLARTDANGITVRQAIRDFGLDPDELATMALHPAAFGYLEFHIEQGPVLESEGAALGVVDAIAGQTRMVLTFTGHANHAGTTPMGSLRHDALAAAAEWIREVERYASAAPGLAATVGKIEVPSGAANVIPGACVATLDLRHAQDAVRQAAVEHLVAFASRASSTRGVQIAHTITLDQSAVPMDGVLTKALSSAVRGANGNATCMLTSGAGHDAMILARRVPSAMVFLRTPGGLSHHPDESVLTEDVEAALGAGLEFLTRLRDDRAMLDQLVTNARAYAEVRNV